MLARVQSSSFRRASAPPRMWHRIIVCLGAVLMLPWTLPAQALVPMTGVRAIEAGEAHTCARTLGGGVKCWGANNTGQLGDGTTTHRETPTWVYGLAGGVTAIAPALYHSCALTTGGAVGCWGANSVGELGTGTTSEPISFPVPVNGLGGGVTAITTTWEHTCALTIGGAVKCWGWNEFGQLGDGSTIDRFAPVQVSGLTGGVTQIAAGGYHACALVGGGVKCWGRNTGGQLGDGTRTNRLTPVDVVGLGGGVGAITAGLNHTCALTTSGAMKCWGLNDYGGLGDGTTTDRAEPVDVTGLSSGVTAISGGHEHTCAIVNGGAMCWGLDSEGQVGNGVDGGFVRTTPRLVSGLSSGVKTITAGGTHTCAIVGDGAAKCWGNNGSGQVGDNTNSSRHAPVDVLVDGNVAPPLGGTLGPSCTQNPSATCGHPVNTATGNWFHQATDLKWPGRGLGFSFTRTYNARSDYSGPLGVGWTHSYNVFLVENPNDASVVVTLGDGRQVYFDALGGGNYVPRYPGVHERLVKGSGFALTTKDRLQFTFGPDGALTAIADRNGNSLQLAYSAGRLASIADTAGRVFSFAYDANGRIVSLTDPATRMVAFAYDASGNLASAVDMRGFTVAYAYDGAHRVTSITDRRGNIEVQNTYDADGRVTSQTNGRGFTMTFAYDTPTPGDTSITNALGNVVIHTHDIQYRLLAERDGLGNWVDYTYDAQNNRTAIVDRNGHATRFTYDARGNPTSVTDPLGNVSTAVYDANDNLTQRTDAAGSVFLYAYDTQGNLVTVTDPLGGATQLAYDAHGQPVSLTDALGRTTLATYDALGNLVKIKDPLNATIQSAYDTAARLVGHTDALGHTTTFTYDAADNLLSVTAPLGQVTMFAYDANGNRTTVTDARGTSTVYAYNQNNRLITVTNGLGGVVSFAYDGADQRVSVTDQRRNSTSFGYDAAGRMTSRANALGQVTQFAYDANGNLTALTNAVGKASTYTYDPMNRRMSITDALGHVALASYDPVGRLAATTDANGRATTYAYDALGRLVHVTDPAGGGASFAYDAVGNRTQVTDPKGHSTTFTYNANNRLLTRSDAVGSTWTYGYDAASRRVNRIDAKGATTIYSYDANDRVVAITYPGPSAVSFEYDASGNRVAMSDGLGSSSFQYDKLNRLVSTTDPFGNVVTYAYDAAGNRVAIGYPGSKQVTYTYDALNRMATVTDWLNGTTQYAYDAAGDLETAFLPNGSTADYVHDDAQRLVGLVNARADHSYIAGYALGLDAAGNRIQITPQGTLAPIFGTATNTYAYDNANRLTSLDGIPGTSDANGNQTAQPGATYAYDFEDRLVAISGGTAQYRYDGLGLRREASRSGITTRYVLDSSSAMSNVLAETDTAGAPIAYYVHGLGLVSRITPDGGVRHYHYDPVGSTVALTDGDGNVTDRYAYDPFGQLRNQQGATANPFRYVGRFGVMHEGDALLFMRARYYNPQLGRFISQDRIPPFDGGTQSLNRLIYAEDDPVHRMDPLGLLSWKKVPGGVHKGISTVIDKVTAQYVHDIPGGAALVRAGEMYTGLLLLQTPALGEGVGSGWEVCIVVECRGYEELTSASGRRYKRLTYGFGHFGWKAQAFRFTGEPQVGWSSSVQAGYEAGWTGVSVDTEGTYQVETIASTMEIDLHTGDTRVGIGTNLMLGVFKRSRSFTWEVSRDAPQGYTPPGMYPPVTPDYLKSGYFGVSDGFGSCGP